MFKRKKSDRPQAEGIVVGGGGAPKPVKKQKVKLMVGADVSPNTARPKKSPVVPVRGLVIGMGIVLVLVVAGLFVSHKKTQDTAIKTAKNELYDNSKKPDYDNIKQNADGIIGSAQTKDQKIQTYLHLAAVASSSNDHKNAIQYYEAAGKLDPAILKQNAYLLAQDYEADGNKAKAVEYYKLAQTYYAEYKPSPGTEVIDESAYYNRVITQKLKELQ